MPDCKAFRVTAKFNAIAMITLKDLIISKLKPILASPDTQLDKNTKKNPHLYPQVHQVVLWFIRYNTW